MSQLAFGRNVADFNVSEKEWLAIHNKHFDGLHASAIVFDSSVHAFSSARILLVQRAARDSMPHKWELPGGAVDGDDVTILDGCARELREETGLTTIRILRRVTEGAGGEALTVFTNSSGKRIFCKFVFEVKVADGAEIVLDPDEHQDWVWASEEEVVEGRVGGEDGKFIPLTAPHVRRIIMEAFKLRKEDEAQI
ncbi:NUDIX hydrolase domain-like protein [Akanthomyces lecanii RCEF 1005]|uniref:NUDIX hydrolase domain-like protein n=1 Tax=Akanthomyces lecanii RCEF 1005 TaxID=1081108 RepID=A0A162IVH9_CORDF|nr:NUDIX hydrolase domain-like protein [Akanthomyces lecanii RCEF 1005]